MLNKRRKSDVWKPSKEEFVQIFDECSSVGEMLSRFNLRNIGSNYKTLQRRFIEDSIDWQKFKDNKTTKGKRRVSYSKSQVENLLIQNSSYTSRQTLKRKIIEYGLLENKCNICGLDPVWNNKKLVMVLDHINGIANDHRIENLRFLCPNCNSQTDTFAGRNLKYQYTIDENNITNPVSSDTCTIRPKKDLIKKYCLICGDTICKKANLCRKCSNSSPKFKTRKVNRPSRDELQKLVWSIPTIEIAKHFGVSDKAISKWCKSYNIDKPSRGYWTKQKHENHRQLQE